jgi:hypothetical protein
MWARGQGMREHSHEGRELGFRPQWTVRISDDLGRDSTIKNDHIRGSIANLLENDRVLNLPIAGE